MEELRPKIDGELMSVELTSRLRTFPPMLSRLSSSTTSRCPSSSHATETPAIPAPMIAPIRRGGAACASTGVVAVAAIVFSTSRHVQVSFMASPSGKFSRVTISRAHRARRGVCQSNGRPLRIGRRGGRERQGSGRARARSRELRGAQEVSEICKQFRPFASMFQGDHATAERRREGSSVPVQTRTICGS